MSLIIQNFVLFQIGWLCCVMAGASDEYWYAGVLVVAVILAIHLLRASNRKNEALLIFFTAFIGTIWDSGLLLAGLYSFDNGTVVNGVIPLWLIAMWALFATTLNVSMKWMKHRYFLAAVTGAAGGPIAYYAGQQLGAVAFSNTSLTLFVIGAGWSVIMPMLVWLGQYFDSYSNTKQHKYRVEYL